MKTKKVYRRLSLRGCAKQPQKPAHSGFPGRGGSPFPEAPPIMAPEAALYLHPSHGERH